MRLLVRATKARCAMCKYRSGVEENGCNYIMVKEHSRIFENGVMQYDPEFCDKFEQGLRVSKEECGWNTARQPMIPRNENIKWGYNPWQE